MGNDLNFTVVPSARASANSRHGDAAEHIEGRIRQELNSGLPRAECPARLDYDCEVCCRPMLIMIDEEGQAQAVGTDDSYSG